MIKKLLIDLDGTVLSGNKPINQSPEFIKKLQKEKIDFLIMTISIKSPEEMKKTLQN